MAPPPPKKKKMYQDLVYFLLFFVPLKSSSFPPKRAKDALFLVKQAQTVGSRLVLKANLPMETSHTNSHQPSRPPAASSPLANWPWEKAKRTRGRKRTRERTLQKILGTPIEWPGPVNLGLFSWKKTRSDTSEWKTKGGVQNPFWEGCPCWSVAPPPFSTHPWLPRIQGVLVSVRLKLEWSQKFLFFCEGVVSPCNNLSMTMLRTLS